MTRPWLAVVLISLAAMASGCVMKNGVSTRTRFQSSGTAAQCDANRKLIITDASVAGGLLLLHAIPSPDGTGGKMVVTGIQVISLVPLAFFLASASKGWNDRSDCRNRSTAPLVRTEPTPRARFMARLEEIRKRRAQQMSVAQAREAEERRLAAEKQRRAEEARLAPVPKPVIPPVTAAERKTWTALETKYPTEINVGLMESCRVSQNAAVCGCILEKFSKKFSLEQLRSGVDVRKATKLRDACIKNARDSDSAAGT